MRRADRLFEIIQIMRRRNVVTAAQLAFELEVSERTIYRDINDLSAAGTPIEAEVGVGYRLSSHFDLPPLMLKAGEIQALVLGCHFVQSWGDASLERHAANAITKLKAVVPKAEREELNQPTLLVPEPPGRDISTNHLAVLRQAIHENKQLKLTYPEGSHKVRIIHPLGLLFWGKHWTLAAWSATRKAFRSYTLEKIVEVEALQTTFISPPGQRLQDYLDSLFFEKD